MDSHKNRRKTAESGRAALLSYVAGYALWDKGRSDEIRSQLGMRQLDKYTKGRNTGWNIYRGCHQKELPRNLHIINR
jgi:hypothetical protein